MGEFVLLKTYYHKYDAEIAIGLLEERGINSMLQSDDLGGYREHLSIGMGNNRIMVRKSDLERAQEIIQTLEDNLSDEEIKELDEVSLFTPDPVETKEDPLQKNKAAVTNEKFIIRSWVGGFSLLVMGAFFAQYYPEVFYGFIIMGIGSIVAGFLISKDKFSLKKDKASEYPEIPKEEEIF